MMSTFSETLKKRLGGGGEEIGKHEDNMSLHLILTIYNSGYDNKNTSEYLQSVHKIRQIR